MTKNEKKSPTKNAAPINKVLRLLMTENSIIEAEVARQTGLPQTTINRLLLGETFDPRTTTLIPIAKFFGVTVGQLVGEEPANPNRIPGIYNPTHRAAWSIIPIIDWNDAASWIFQKEKYNPSNHNEWITTEQENSQEAFALRALEFMEPRFKRNSIIIVDPKFRYSDGSYVIISINSGDATVRRIMKDGSDVSLKKLYGTDKPVKLTTRDNIIGTITETRIKEG